jgi:hypothetical protein
MQWIPSEKKEQPEQELDQEPDDLTIAYMAGFYDGKNTPQPKPEQEPVAWMDEYGDVLSASVVDGNGLRNIPLYTAPPKREWVGLTEEEIEVIGKDDKVLLAQFHTSVKAIDEMKDPTAQIMNLVIRQQGFNFAKAIEAKLREKNEC